MEFIELQKQITELKDLTLLGAKQALTMSDASLLTGLTKSTLYKMVCLKKIPYYKSQGGKFTYFDRNELNKWMLFARMSTRDEIESEADTYLATGGK